MKTEGVPASGGAEARISAEKIRRRAYELWERHHHPAGLELRFWLLAEQQLRAEAGSDAGHAESRPMADSPRTGDVGEDAAKAANGRAKPAYRVLILDALDNVLGTETLLAQTDSEALALATAMAGDSKVELWEGLRFIEQVAAARRPSPTPSS